MKNVIFTQRVDVIEAYNERRDCADQRISKFIIECGFMPVPVPNSFGRETLEGFIAVLDPAGIILTGGNSLVKYGGNAPERDFTETVLMDLAKSKGLPVYGLCRGMQFILDYFGQDLQNVAGHVAVRHVLDNGREVNSYHNQACLNLKGTELAVLARAHDGVIESVRHTTLPMLGTMWHPEREEVFVQDDIHTVRTLFDTKELIHK